MLTKKQKDQIVEKYKTHKTDTGSSQVQIAILTAEIKDLTKHLKSHSKDYSSRRGLLRKVSQRRRLLRYLESEDDKSFDKIVKQLKIKITKRETRDLTPDEDIDAAGVDEEDVEI